MKVTALEYRRIKLEMKKPFKIALGSTDYYEGVFSSPMVSRTALTLSKSSSIDFPSFILKN